MFWEEDGQLINSEFTNMLKKGGVYLLPLWHWENDVYLIYSDLDVLFEIDDYGLVWSHSIYPDFNRFDGKLANVLADAILAVVP